MEHWHAIRLAERYVLLERGERALEVLEHASPEEALSWLWRANALHELAQYDEAIEAAKRGLAIEPDNSYLHHAVARAALQLSRFAEAEAAILESLRLNPEEPEALGVHALILSGRGKRKEAAKVIRQAAELAPELRSVRVVRAMVDPPIDDEAAVRISGELLQAEPEGAFEHWLHALNLVRRGRLRDAADHFGRAAALKPDDETFVRAALISRHWFFWPLRVTSPFLLWLAVYSMLPLLMLAADFGGILWPLFWSAVAWTAYTFVYMLTYRFARRRASR